MNLGKLCCDVTCVIFYNFPNIDTLSAFNFHHPRLINFIKSISKTIKTRTSVSFKQTTTYVFCCNAWKIILVSPSSWLNLKTFVTLLDILNISFPLLTSIGNILEFTKSLAHRYLTNKLKRLCLFLMSWKNPNHFLLGRIFSSKLWKCTRVLDYSLLYLEQFLALDTHCSHIVTDNGFKLPLGRMNFCFRAYYEIRCILT